MPQVRMLHGRMAGMVQEVPVHAVENLLMTGQAEVVENTPEVLRPKGRKRDPDARVVTVESDAAGEVVKAPAEAKADPEDVTASHATEGRAAEPRRPESAPDGETQRLTTRSVGVNKTAGKGRGK